VITGHHVITCHHVLFRRTNCRMSSSKEFFDEVAKDKQLILEERMKWEEEKVKINKTFVFHGQVIDLNVGGTRYSTSRSTLNKYPESMLGVIFSGRHDLDHEV